MAVPKRKKSKMKIRMRKAQKKAEIPATTTCPACGAPVVRREGEVAVRCTNFNCPAQLVERLAHFASRDALDIEGLGDKVADALVQMGDVRKPMDLFRLDRYQLQGLVLREEEKPDEGTAPVRQGLLFGLDDAAPAAASTTRRTLGEKNAETIVRAIAATREKPLSRWLFALGIPGIGDTVAEDIARHHRDLRDLAHSSLLADARRLYAIQEELPRCSPRSQAVRAMDIEDRLAATERHEALSKELDELGRRLVADGTGQRLKTGPLAYSCVLKPEAVRALDGFFASEGGREFLADMERLGINPKGGKSADAPAESVPQDGPFAGKTVVVTGSFHDVKRPELTKLLQGKGAKVVSSVSRATDLVVAGENPGADKLSAAAEYGTAVMREKEAREALGLPALVVQASLF